MYIQGRSKWGEKQNKKQDFEPSPHSSTIFTVILSEEALGPARLWPACAKRKARGQVACLLLIKPFDQKAV